MGGIERWFNVVAAQALVPLLIGFACAFAYSVGYFRGTEQPNVPLSKVWFVQLLWVLGVALIVFLIRRWG